MTVVDKLIYNALIQKGGVNLPDIGSLYISTGESKFISDNRIQAPRKYVKYSVTGNPVYESIVDIIARDGNLDREKAEAVYLEWLNNARSSSGDIIIEDTGVIKAGEFYPEGSLKKLLGKENATVICVKKRISPARRILIWILAIILLLCLLCIINRFILDEPIKLCSRSTKSEVIVEKNTTTIVTQTTTETDEEQVVDAVVTAPKTDGENSLSAVPRKTYHVVVGVFRIESNADNFMKYDYLGLGRNAYKKYPFGKDMHFISVYTSDCYKDADKRKCEIIARGDDAWVYRYEE